MLTAAGW